jgi:hypothetical protein
MSLGPFYCDGGALGMCKMEHEHICVEGVFKDG